MSDFYANLWFPKLLCLTWDIGPMKTMKQNPLAVAAGFNGLTMSRLVFLNYPLCLLWAVQGHQTKSQIARPCEGFCSHLSLLSKKNVSSKGTQNVWRVVWPSPHNMSEGVSETDSWPLSLSQEGQWEADCGYAPVVRRLDRKQTTPIWQSSSANPTTWSLDCSTTH